MDIKQFTDILFKKAEAAGFTEFEIYFVEDESASVTIYKTEIEKYENNKRKGLSFRGLYGGVMGYAYAERMDEDVADLLIESAKQNAEVIDAEETEFIYGGAELSAYGETNTYFKALEAVGLDEKIEKAKLMEQAVLNADPRIKSVSSAVISGGCSYVSLVNSKGVALSQRANYIMAYLSAIGEENGQTKTYGDAIFLNDWKRLDPVKFGFDICHHLVAKFPGDSIPTGDYPIIIQNKTFAELLSAFCGVLFAEKVQKGFSLLGNKLQQQVASTLVTLEENPFLTDGYANASFDSEGVPTTHKKIIEDGILKTYLYNLKSADKGAAVSTGNGFKASFKASVGTGFTNLFVAPHKQSFGGMVAEMNEGLIITDFNGLHSGTNAVSGDFSLAAEGFLVQSGKIVQAVAHITVAGNFYRLLQDIVAVGNDLKFLLPGGSGCVGSPSVYIKALKVAGAGTDTIE